MSARIAKFGLALAAGAALALPSVSAAQGTAIVASATVVTNLTVNAGADLLFPDVTVGSQGFQINPTDNESGSWTILGAVGAEVVLAFTLPQELVNGTETLPITFDLTSAAVNTVNDRASAGATNPGVNITTNLDATTGNLFVFIGGAVGPVPLLQAVGQYTGEIVLEAAYTGN